MLLGQHTVTLLLLASFIAGASIFALGYFPLSFSDDVRASLEDLPVSIDDVPLNRTAYRSLYNKSVLMIIDALRLDFAWRPDQMKYLHKLLNTSEACMLNIHVNSPTVTLPRIKSITTGTVPNFIDVALNFGNAALTIDSIIEQLNRLSRRIVFCGDDTWTKLFPTSFARALANSDSLYVNDFYGGDANITQQLNAELRHADWDLLVLHYLGLDHIGHVEGPFSGRVPGKLLEMDNVVQRIHLELETWRARVDLRSLLLVTGDHGMRDTGGHGGNSYAETHVPLFVAGAKCAPSDVVYQQTDIAPTLSVLLGTPIPANSIGSLIPELLAQLPVVEQLYALHYNARRLVQKLAAELGDDRLESREFYLQYREASELHKQYVQLSMSAGNDRIQQYGVLVKRAHLLYVSATREMSAHLATNYVNYDYVYIGVGLSWTTVTLFGLLVNTAFCRPAELSVRLSARNLLFFIMVMVCTKDIFCRSCHTSNAYAICNWPYWQTAVMAVLLAIVGQFQWTVCGLQWRRFTVNVRECDRTLLATVIGTVVHAALLGSSSFVEEEHQTWYAMCVALLLVLAVREIRVRLREDRARQVPGLEKDVTARNVEAELVWPPLRWCFNHRIEIAWFAVLSMMAAVRRLNQTGDKWLSVPDVGDWLQMEVNRGWQSVWMGVSLVLIVYCCSRFSGMMTNVLALTASVLIYYFRTQTGAVSFVGFKASESNTSVIIFWLNILEIVCINYVPVAYKLYQRKPLQRADVHACLGANVVICCLSTALLHKPHNVVLNAVLLFVCDRVHSACARIFAADVRLRFAVETVAHFWLGTAFFYYQGNSNSLASVDLNAGYVGLKGFHMGAAAVLITLNTYSAVFLTWNVLLYHAVGSKCDGPTLSRLFGDIMSIIASMVAIPLTTFLFVTTLFQSHIFVWTVFSPKLIYALYSAYLWLILLTGAYILQKIMSCRV